MLDQILRDYDIILASIEGAPKIGTDTFKTYKTDFNVNWIKAKRDRLMAYVKNDKVVPSVEGEGCVQDETDVRTKLLTIIKELSDRDRLLVILRYMEGLRYGEIAVILGLTMDELHALHWEIKQKFLKVFRGE